MSRQHHHLKCETEYYQAIERKEKMFEVRKNDRNFKIGDMIYLKETMKITAEETGREQGPFEITFIIHGGIFGIHKDYCVMQLQIP